MQGAFYATPILYPISVVSALNLFAAKALLLNPMAQIIQDARYLLVTPQTATGASTLHGFYVYVPFVVVILVAITASFYFKRNSGRFAENV